MNRSGISRKDFAIKMSLDNDTGEFEAYFAAFNNVDRQSDVIVPGAFKNLDEFVRSGWIAQNHNNHTLPIAYPVSAEQDDYGLKITGRFHATAEAQSCRTVIRERLAAGKDVMCSIGFRVTEETRDVRDNRSVSVLKALHIHEASFVNMPANPMARAVAVKSDDEVISLDKLSSEINRIKSGRVLSRANLKRFADWAKALDAHGCKACEMAKDIKEYLSKFGENDDDDDESDDETDEPEKAKSYGERRSALERRRLSLRAIGLKPYFGA